MEEVSGDTWAVALRKESVDRNNGDNGKIKQSNVALRKESVDRNHVAFQFVSAALTSLSARRAWIEIRNGFAMR